MAKKLIKLRFVGRCKNVSSKPTDYLVQQKKWYGWRYLSYSVDSGYGTVNYLYCSNSKKNLLKNILDNHFQIGGKFVKITEYPMIKTYCDNS